MAQRPQPPAGGIKRGGRGDIVGHDSRHARPTKNLQTARQAEHASGGGAADADPATGLVKDASGTYHPEGAVASCASRPAPSRAWEPHAKRVGVAL